ASCGLTSPKLLLKRPAPPLPKPAAINHAIAEVGSQVSAAAPEAPSASLPQTQKKISLAKYYKRRLENQTDKASTSAEGTDPITKSQEESRANIKGNSTKQDKDPARDKLRIDAVRYENWQ